MRVLASPVMPACADSVVPPDSRTSSSTATVVAAASAGSLAIANANDRSGSSAMPVPSAMIPKPNQIQLTSGLTTSCSVTD